MAYYHCKVEIISRTQGRTSVASASYRSGEKLYDEYTGETHDYSRKRGIEFSEIILPECAPKEFKNRENLWNTVEMSGKSFNYQTAREIEIALPSELSLEQQIELVRDYIQTTVIPHGLIADYSIHNPPRKDDLGRCLDRNGNPTKDPNEYIYYNPHCHILTTLRPLDKDGNFIDKKSEMEYLCINPKTGEEKCFTASEFKDVKEQGWEKQYQYILSDGQKCWYPESQGKMQELERVNRFPKSTRYGRKDPVMVYLSSTDYVREIRKSWETVCNRHLELAGIRERIDCRSFADQGIDRIPSMHKGPAVTAMERRAERLAREGSSEAKTVRTHIAHLNAEIRKYNYVLSKIQGRIDDIDDKDRQVAERLENLREQITYSRFQLKRLRDSMTELDLSTDALKMKVENYQNNLSDMNGRLLYHQNAIKDLKDKSDKKRKWTAKSSLKTDIDYETQQIKAIQESITRLKVQNGYDNDAVLQADIDTVEKSEDVIKKMMAKIAEISDKEKALHKEYMDIKSTIPKTNYNNVYRHQMSIRSCGSTSIFGGFNSLYNLIRQSFDDEEEEERKRRR